MHSLVQLQITDRVLGDQKLVKNGTISFTIFCLGEVAGEGKNFCTFNTGLAQNQNILSLLKG